MWEFWCEIDESLRLWVVGVHGRSLAWMDVGGTTTRGSLGQHAEAATSTFLTGRRRKHGDDNPPNKVTSKRVSSDGAQRLTGASSRRGSRAPCTLLPRSSPAHALALCSAEPSTEMKDTGDSPTHIKFKDLRLLAHQYSSGASGARSGWGVSLDCLEKRQESALSTLSSCSQMRRTRRWTAPAAGRSRTAASPRTRIGRSAWIVKS